MSVIGTLLTKEVAERTNKLAFFFSRYNFMRMKARGNTHYCFCCGGSFGFTPDADGKPTNHTSSSGYNPMKKHDASHDVYTIQNADKYDNPWDWFRVEISAKGKDFPCVVSIQSID